MITDAPALDDFRVMDWTTAPLRLARSVQLQAAPPQSFDSVADHAKMAELFPWIQSVTVDNSQAETVGGLGALRCCSFGPGMLLEERIVGWQPPAMYAYACRDDSPFGLTDHLGLVTCEAGGPESTVLTWRLYFNHPNPVAMQEKIDGSFSLALDSLCRRYGGQLLEIYSIR